MGNGFSYGIRRALHAGELYERDEDAITERLQEYLRESSTLLTPSDAPFDENVLLQKPLRALIVPAAVVPTMTSDDETVLTTKRLQKDTGPTFGAAYSKLNPLTLRRVRTIVILHHPTLPELSGKCSITGADELETPTTNLRVNAALREQLLQCPYVNPYLDILSKNKEEKEVSAEIHFPWIAHCLRTTHLTEQVSVLPIMIGNLSTKDEINLGIALKRHFCLQRDILVLLATNLCTWGKELHSSYQPVTALKHLDQRRERQTRKPKRRLSTVEHAVTELDREVVRKTMRCLVS